MLFYGSQMTSATHSHIYTYFSEMWSKTDLFICRARASHCSEIREPFWQINGARSNQTTVTPAFTWCVSGIKFCERLCLCNYVNAFLSLSLSPSVCIKDRASIYDVSRVFSCVHLTSLSLFSYLPAFLPWLFLLSFFKSDWDLSSESCFILCSIWYLLNVAWSRGKIPVNAGTEI